MALNLIKFSQFATGNLANATNMLVGVSANSGGTNYKIPAINSWITSGRPVTPATGTLGYNTSLGQYEFWNGAAWVQLAAGGSGTINLGGAGQIAYYATSGTAVSGTNTIPNTVQIEGVTNGTDATGGDVGEYVTSNIPGASSILLGNGAFTDITSISLTAGDWDVFGNIYFASSSLTNPQFRAWTSATSATQPDASRIAQINYNDITNTNTEAGLVCPYLRVSTTSTIPVYLSAFCLTSGGQSIASGSIFARRVR